MFDDTDLVPDPFTRTGTLTCVRCGLTATALAPDGDRRDHCPGCLHARHLPAPHPSAPPRSDPAGREPGGCRASMAPISVAVLPDGSWAVVHRCTGCDELTCHPVRQDDNRLVLMHTAVRPLARPPFPLEALGDL